MNQGLGYRVQGVRDTQMEDVLLPHGGRVARGSGNVCHHLSLAMTLDTWLEAAKQDADRRGLPGLKPLLEALAKATATLRGADWTPDARGEAGHAQTRDAR